MKEKVVNIEKYRDSLSPEKLLDLDPEVAERAFNKLPLKRKVEVVLSAPWRKMMDIILMAENSREIVQALPEEEVYWAVKDRGEEDSLALISMTTQEQFQYMIDIDCWDKDKIDSSSIAKWYKLLGKCHESKVIEWFNKADEEFLICSFKKFFKVFKIEGESDISEEYENMPFYTLDNVYYFQFSNNDDRLIIMPFLNVLYQHNKNFFYSIIERVIWDLEIEAEEEASRWRRSRIAERGFPDLEEATGVYQFISDKEIEMLMQRNKDIRNDDNEAKLNSYGINLRYAFNQEKPPSFFFSVTQGIENHQLMDDIQRYVVNIANKIIMADSLKVREIEDMKRSLRKAAGYINIGLEVLSEGRINKAKYFLENIHPAVLFRIGYSRLLKLKNRVKEQKGCIWLKYKEMFSTFFDTPWADVISGLDRSCPVFFKGVIKKGSVEYGNFEDLEQVRETEQVIDIVEVAEKLLFDVFRVEPEYLITGFVNETALNNVSEIKCTSVFLTILANHILYGKIELSALTNAELKDFLGRVFEQEEGTDCFNLKKNIYDESISWICSQYFFDENLKPALKSFVYICLKMLEEEFSTLVKKKTIDKRYVSGIILKKERRRKKGLKS